MIDVGKMIFDEISAKSRQAKKRNSYQFKTPRQKIKEL